MKMKLSKLEALRPEHPQYVASLEAIGRVEGEYLVSLIPTAVESLMRQHRPQQLESQKSKFKSPEFKPTQWNSAVRMAVALIASERAAEDKGLGDTMARKFGKAGAKFQEWFKKLFGRQCGCKDRQAWLNRHFPYGQDGVQFL